MPSIVLFKTDAAGATGGAAGWGGAPWRIVCAPGLPAGGVAAVTAPHCPQKLAFSGSGCPH